MPGYTGHRGVPRKVVCEGNLEESKRLIGEADSQLRILEQQMTFQGLKQAVRTVRPFPGVLIQCWSCFTQQGVRIITPGGQPDKVEITLRECLCGCNFAVGQIVEVIEVENADYKLYTVKACNSKTYTQYENILGSDFTPWEVGQVVLLMAYNDFLYDCCNSTYNSTGCSPLKDETNEVLAESWRSTYRIVPLDGAKIPKWVTVSG